MNNKLLQFITKNTPGGGTALKVYKSTRLRVNKLMSWK